MQPVKISFLLCLLLISLAPYSCLSQEPAALDTASVKVEAVQTTKVVWEDQWKTHKVKKGETLKVVARKYAVSSSDITKWNKLKSSSLKAGQSLKIKVKVKKTITIPEVIEESKPETPTAIEIIQWLNNFEDSNSIERIMEGTFEDKVNLHYEDSVLTINSMYFGSISGPPSKIREVFLIKDIKQIEAFPTIKGDFTIVEIFIKFDPGKIKLECKKYDEAYFKECEHCSSFFAKHGFISSSLRFKFPNSKSEEYTQKVYTALEKLAKMHGANPKIGSIF